MKTIKFRSAKDGTVGRLSGSVRILEVDGVDCKFLMSRFNSEPSGHPLKGLTHYASGLWVASGDEKKSAQSILDYRVNQFEKGFFAERVARAEVLNAS